MSSIKEVKAAVLNPSVPLLMKLGSIAIHVEEAMSVEGHPFDVMTLRSLLEDREVRSWLAEMDKLALLPLKRQKKIRR